MNRAMCAADVGDCEQVVDACMGCAPSLWTWPRAEVGSCRLVAEDSDVSPVVAVCVSAWVWL